MDIMIDALFNSVEWKEVPWYIRDKSHNEEMGLPYTTHEGVIKLGKIELRVYILSDGRRIIDGEDFDKYFGT